ncbi:MAG: HAMP domain-containing protein [Chloroflexi bacterium]|nr:HAMP domain-containing protein [Chloroflexota bacterium]
MPRVTFNRLGVKLSLAFLGIAIIAVGLVAYLMNAFTSRQFVDYLGHSQAMQQMMQGMMGGSGGMMFQPGSAEQSFLDDVNRSLWTAGIIAGGAAVVIGLVITRQIVAPLQRLNLAAQRIAAGDLKQRVPAESGDETGQLAASFNAMTEALSLNEELRRHMVADIAHELRTPLSILQGNLEGMRDGVIKPTPEQLDSLHHEAQSLSRLVDDLSTLSLAEAGQLKLRLRSINVADVITSVASAMGPQARQAGVSLTTSLAQGLPAVTADPDRIAEVLRNLLSNALRHTPQGESIQVSARPSPGPPSGVLVSVSDTGQGIPAQELPYVFERFYRVDRSRARSTGGAGIGLTIVKQLVEAHGGGVWAESTPDKGSTFYFTLPAKVQPAAETPAAGKG